MELIIICAKGHWQNGWFTNLEELNVAVNIIQKSGLSVKIAEIEYIDELNALLDKLSPYTLVWTNAYYVNKREGGVAWLNDEILKRSLSLVGSSGKTLKTVLQKDICQTKLQKEAIPIPEFGLIPSTQIKNAKRIIEESQIDFPIVLKPTAESGSLGVDKAENLEEAVNSVNKILLNFPHSNVIFEAFLPSDDITCGFFQLGEEVLLLPTKYIVKSADGKNHILARKQRLSKWDGEDKIQPYISTPQILQQLKTYIPQIIDILEVSDITRIDGRLDKHGQIRFFDVNGLPALSFPDSVIIEQCFSCFPDYNKEEVYEAIINTIIASALLRYNMEIPSQLQEHNLFKLESEFVIRTKARQKNLS